MNIKSLISDPDKLENSTAAGSINAELEKVKNDIELSYTKDEYSPSNQLDQWQRFTDSSVNYQIII